MEWWSDLWLNEGFATWVGWLAADHLFPEWDIWTEFVQDDCQQGLTLDSMRSSHPIEVPVRDPAEISQIFDAISYSKGASVIRMLVEHLGEQAFQRGLQHYLRAFQYANAQTRDLWQALGDASGQDIHSLMHHWTKSPGFPLILVEESNGQASGKTTTGCGSCCLRQSRFLSSGKAKADEDTITWQVPVHIKTDTLTSKQLVTARQSALDLAEDNASFVKLNAGQSGFYRVKYPPTWLVRLGKAVEASALGAADRLGLVSDVFALAYSGDAVLSEALTLLGHFSKEDNHLVWGQIQGRLQQILSVWFEEPEEVQQRIKHFCRQLVSPAALRSGFDFPAGEPDAQRLLRPILLGLAARAQEPAILAEARERFERFRVQQATSAIHPDLRGVIFGAMMREARTEAEAMDLFEYFVALYGDASLVPDLRLAALGSTGASAYAKVTQRALDLLVQPNSVLRPQDHHYVVSAVGNGPLRRQCWQFVHEHWSHFEQLFSKGSMSMLGYLIKGSCSALCSPADAQSVLAFFAPLDTSKVDRAIEQSVERIRANADFLQRNRPDLERFFSSLSSRPPLQ
jgi:aminopeptidase 2